MRVTWIHPSGRDTAIEYLMDHDAERVNFLRTATASGVLLAVSLAGGAQGTRELPLLRNDADWDALSQTVERIGRSGHDSERIALLRGFAVALRTAPAHEHHARLVETARRLLGALFKGSSEQDRAISPDALGLFYDLTVTTKLLVASPNLAPTWAAEGGTVDEAIAGDLGGDDLAVVAAWISFIQMLRRNEPRFVRMQAWDEDVDTRIARFLEAVQHRLDRLATLEQFEDVLVDTDSGEEETPVEPDPSEDYERRWIAAATQAVQAAIGLGGKWNEHAQGLVDALDSHHETRQVRRDRYDEWESSQEDEGDWEQARDQGAGDFDLVAFFADL